MTSKRANRQTKKGPGKTDKFVLEKHLFYLFGQALGRRDIALGKSLSYLGIGVTQWRILASLHSRNNLPMKVLAALTATDRTTLTRVADKMEAEGLIKRFQDQNDRRARRLQLTPSGENLFDKVLPLILEQNKKAIRGIKAAEITQFRSVLNRIIENLEAPF